jgi:hypothetical protein
MSMGRPLTNKYPISFLKNEKKRKKYEKPSKILKRKTSKSGKAEQPAIYGLPIGFIIIFHT